MADSISSHLTVVPCLQLSVWYVCVLVLYHYTINNDEPYKVAITFAAPDFRYITSKLVLHSK